MNYQLVRQGSKNSMRLQQVGLVQGTPSGEIKVGSKLMWNFRATSTVLEVLKETEKTIFIKTLCDESGNTYERRFAKTRLVCILND